MAVNASFLGLALFLAATLAAAAQEPVPLPVPKPKPGPASERSANSVPLSLADAVFLGLRHNRTIRSAHIDRIAEKFDLRVAEDRFTPKFSVTGSVVRQRIADVTTTTVDVSPGVTMLTPTGAVFDFAWATTNANSDTLDSYRSAAEISLTQPLLRGGGVAVNTAPVKSARLAERINRLRLRATVSETVAQIILAYRDLLRAQEEQKLARATLARAVDLLRVNKALITAGRMAAVDIVQTEADVENQRLRLLSADNGVETARLLLLELLALDLDTPIIASERLDPARVPTDRNRLLAVALAERPDYQSQLLVVAQRRLGVMVAENEQLWDVSLFANGRFGREEDGLAGVQRLADVTVGVNVNVALNDLEREQSFVHAATAERSAELQLAAIRQGVERQVRASIADINTNWQQFQGARRARELAARAVAIEKDKLNAGRSSTFQVRSLENDLRAAETQELNATIGYLNALTQLDLQVGTTLDTWRIALRDEGRSVE